VAPTAATSARVSLVLGPVTNGVPTNDAQVWFDGVEFGPVAVGTTTTSSTTTTTATPTTTTLPGMGSLLVNGGFEDGRTGWADWDSSQNAGEVVRTDAVPCEGDWSVQMFDSSTRTRSIYQDVAVVGGAAYALSVVTRTQNLGSGQARVTIAWRGPSGVVGGDAIAIAAGTRSCTPDGETYVAPTAATSARVSLVLGPVTNGVPRNDAQVWYDRVTLARIP
jgi:hypothetical protein